MAPEMGSGFPGYPVCAMAKSRAAPQPFFSPRYRAKLLASPAAASHSTFVRPSSCPVNLSRNLLLTLGIYGNPVT